MPRLTNSEKWLYEKVCYSSLDHPTNTYSQLFWHWEEALEAKGWLITSANLIAGSLSLCIENLNGTGPHLGGMFQTFPVFDSDEGKWTSTYRYRFKIR